MLPILSNITLLLQAIVSAIATIAWFGNLLGAHRLAFSAIWRLALTLLPACDRAVVIYRPTGHIDDAGLVSK